MYTLAHIWNKTAWSALSLNQVIIKSLIQTWDQWQVIELEISHSKIHQLQMVSSRYFTFNLLNRGVGHLHGVTRQCFIPKQRVRFVVTTIGWLPMDSGQSTSRSKCQHLYLELPQPLLDWNPALINWERHWLRKYTRKIPQSKQMTYTSIPDCSKSNLDLPGNTTSYRLNGDMNGQPNVIYI